MPQISDVVAASAQAVSVRYNSLVYDLHRRGEKVIVLSLGEAFFDVPLYPMDDLPYPELYHYSHSRGIFELREKIAAYYAGHFGVHVDPEAELLVTAGSKAAIHFAMMAVLNPGDEVLMREPLWVSYPEQTKLCHGVPVQLPYTATVEDYERNLTDRTRLMIVNNPNNPCGSVLSEREVRYLADLARSADIYLLADEAYGDFAIREPFISTGVYDEDKSHTIICNSISKTFGISGWRIGYAISNPTLVDNLLKINQHVITCAPTILQQYMAKHFEDVVEIADPQIREVVEKREEVARYLDSVGLDYLKGSSTFYLFVSIAPTKLTSEEFCTRLLEEERVAVVPGSGYGRSCDAFVRVSVGAEPTEEIRTAIDRMRGLVDRTS